MNLQTLGSRQRRGGRLSCTEKLHQFSVDVAPFLPMMVIGLGSLVRLRAACMACSKVAGVPVELLLKMFMHQSKLRHGDSKLTWATGIILRVGSYHTLWRGYIGP